MYGITLELKYAAFDHLDIPQDVASKIYDSSRSFFPEEEGPLNRIHENMLRVRQRNKYLSI